MTNGRVVIVGAGIGGLAAALALAREGVEVHVLERAPVLDEAGAGVQISPNASGILNRLGVLKRLHGLALEPTAIHVRRARDGATLQRLSLADARTRWGAPYLVAHRGDLQAALLAAGACEPRIVLTTGTIVDHVVEEAAGVTIRRSDGHDAAPYDAMIGADGLHSATRRTLWPDVPSPLAAGRTAWRALVPAAEAPRFARAPETSLWLGPRAHLVHYPLRGGTLINIVAIVEDHARPVDAAAWSTPGEADVVRAAFGAWGNEARDLIAAATDWRTWPLFDLEALPRWSRGRIALLGDAAHAALPFLAQGAAQAIEDAAALQRAWADAATPAAALAAYEHRRRGRAARVQAISRRQGRIYHLSGPAALARDAAMRLMGSRRTLARFDWLYTTA